MYRGGNRMEWIVFEIPIAICMLIFGGIGVYALKSKKPIHFWSGTTVKPEEISDIRAYNRANAKMWFVFDIPFVVAFVVAPFEMMIAAGCILFGCTVGLGLIIATYARIEKKYRVKKH